MRLFFVSSFRNLDHISGEWDVSRIDEDKLAQKLGSGKAAKVLGITEDQVQKKEH